MVAACGLPGARGRIMIQLTTLGSVDLRASDGRVLHAIVVQPKRLALLAYLAIDGRGRFHQRDTLLATFWPDLDSDHARNALNKAVHYVRAESGDAVLVGRGDRELGVDPTRLTCDAADFNTLIRGGRPAPLGLGSSVPFDVGAFAVEDGHEQRRTRRYFTVVPHRGPGGVEHPGKEPDLS